MRVLDLNGLRAKGITYSSSYLRKLWQRGDFPVPSKPTPRKLWWSEETIDAWLAERVKK
jgi:predicted DNA-binding transcriptional regulator AlpA